MLIGEGFAILSEFAKPIGAAWLVVINLGMMKYGQRKRTPEASVHIRRN